nr:E3 ubiquitin-protein ligase Praja-2-like [Ipomoea batatas]
MVKAVLLLFSILAVLTNALDYGVILLSVEQLLQEFCILHRSPSRSPSATRIATAGLSASSARSVLAAMVFVFVAALERRWRLICRAKRSDDEEYEVESPIICLRDEVLAEELGEECRSFIFSEGLCYWPIDAGTVLDIADEVVQKALQFKRNLRVEIRSVQIRGGSDDVQETLTYEDDDDRDFGGADGGCVDIKSLKRKRIAYDERDCCVICLEVLTAGTDVGVMPCRHYSFHHDCLSSWLERSPSCPLWRRKMSAATAATAADSPS